MYTRVGTCTHTHTRARAGVLQIMHNTILKCMYECVCVCACEGATDVCKTQYHDNGMRREEDGNVAKTVSSAIHAAATNRFPVRSDGRRTADFQPEEMATDNRVHGVGGLSEN